MKFVFLMDPLETVIFEKDTSFILMIGARRKAHEIYFVPDGGISIKDNQLIFSAVKIRPQLKKEKPFIVGPAVTLSQNQVDAVFVRNDPPFDQQYLMNTWLLDRLPSHIPVLNSPRGIRTVNEKVWVSQFTALVPRTLITRDRAEMMKFIAAEKDVIAKPTDAFGGQMVFQVKKGDSNINVILEALTQRGTKEIILQQYIPAAAKGDKRILLLNGEPLGAVLRVHAKGEHRNNFFAGGKPVAARITARDREIISALKPHLLRLGLYFVGIDVIGDYLIEVNVTSPTCMQEMNRLYKKQLEDHVINFVEDLIAKRKADIKII